MKLIKILIAVLMVFGVAQASAKEPKAPKAIVVYAVGVATSFNDSVAYFTEMQVLNDATLDRDRYLHRRSGYSFQLRDYLLGQGKENFTCLDKVKARFSKDNISLIEIKEADFKFTKPDEL